MENDLTLIKFNIAELPKARERAGLSQADAARALGISRQRYRNYESGHCTPSPDMLARILALFGAQFENFVSGATVVAA